MNERNGNEKKIRWRKQLKWENQYPIDKNEIEIRKRMSKWQNKILTTETIFKWQKYQNQKNNMEMKRKSKSKEEYANDRNKILMIETIRKWEKRNPSPRIDIQMTKIKF